MWADLLPFVLGLIVGAIGGAAALAIVTQRCYCEPENE